MNTSHVFRGLTGFALAALPLAVISHAASAQVESDESTSTAQTLNPIVVTAALAPRTADESLASVTLLDEATLRRQDPTSLTDLLRGQPGVDVTTQGSFGKQSSVFVRGTGSNANVLLIDGIRLRSATSGGAAWEFLDPRMFERAEIVRGPRGSLYGADAVGGVIQLFTPEGEGEPTPRFSIGGGSFGSQRYSASLSGAEGGTRYHFAASRFDTEGQPVRRDSDDKGYDNTTGLVRLSHTFGGGAEVGMLALRGRGNTEFDESGPAEDDFVQQVAAVYAEAPVTDTWSSRITLSEARDERDTVTPFREDVYSTETQVARWDNTLRIGRNDFIVGAEYSKDDIGDSEVTAYLPPFFNETIESYDGESRDNVAAFVQALFDFSPLSIQASLRHDDNEDYGEELTGSLGLGYELDNQHILRASYGTAYRAPTFNELYFPGFQNPDLKPEESKSFELGVNGQYRYSFWDLAIFRNDVDYLIVNVDTTSDGYIDTPRNVEEARIYGAELSAGIKLDDWALRSAISYLEPENRSGGNSGKRLVRRATQSLRLDLDRELGDWSMGASWIVQDHRYDDAANEKRLPGYGLLNLRAGWEFAPMWSARLTVENALDKEYATAKFLNGDDYINAGRSAFLSVHFGQ